MALTKEKLIELFESGVFDEYLSGTACPYQIGQPYISKDPTSPATIYPGTTWEALTPGTTIVAGASTGNFIPGDATKGEGGATAHDHTLGAGHARVYVHTDSGHLGARMKSVTSYNQTHYFNHAGNAQTYSVARTRGAELGGSTDSGSSMPPWRAYYVWERKT